jgi:hypothetical protein
MGCHFELAAKTPAVTALLITLVALARREPVHLATLLAAPASFLLLPIRLVACAAVLLLLRLRFSSRPVSIAYCL